MIKIYNTYSGIIPNYDVIIHPDDKLAIIKIATLYKDEIIGSFNYLSYTLHDYEDEDNEDRKYCGLVFILPDDMILFVCDKIVCFKVEGLHDKKMISSQIFFYMDFFEDERYFDDDIFLRVNIDHMIYDTSVGKIIPEKDHMIFTCFIKDYKNSVDIYDNINYMDIYTK
jgi:hypothetical protein